MAAMLRCKLKYGLVLLGVLGLCWLVPMATSLAQAVEIFTYQMPKGAVIPVVLQERITSENAVVGQPVHVMLAQDVYVGTHRILSKNDRILGRVNFVEPPLQGRNALLRINFDTLILSDGVSIPIQALTHTGREDYCWGGELTPGTQPEIIPYNVYRIGTYGRVMYHGPREMGAHINLLPGERFVLVLQESVNLYSF